MFKTQEIRHVLSHFQIPKSGVVWKISSCFEMWCHITYQVFKTRMSRFSVNLLVFHHNCHSLIGRVTYYQFCGSSVPLLTKQWPLLGVFKVSVKGIQIKFEWLVGLYIVNRGNWLWSPANFKGANKDAKILCWKVHNCTQSFDLHLYTMHELCNRHVSVGKFLSPE